MEIVLDKSFLDGAPTALVHELCDRHTAILSEDLFYELMTTDPASQKRCFAKLPDRVNPVALVPHVGLLLAFERERQEPCVRITRHRVQHAYIFNKALRDGTYVFEGEPLETLNRWRAQVKEDTQRFMERCLVVHEFFPELNGIEWKDFPAAVRAARRKVAGDLDFVRSIYASFLDQEAPQNAPREHRIDQNWAFFRWMQCQLLASLRLFERYQGRMPAQTSEEFWTRVEHSMHDVYYVILGSLAGGLASIDNEIRDDLLLLSPGAALWPLSARPPAGSSDERK